MTGFATFASFSGAAAVAFGAFGAHALKNRFTAHPTQYQLIHSLALLYASSLAPLNGAALVASYAFATGITLFSGSIYGLCLLPEGHGARKILGPLTPLGGLSFIVGWVALAYTRRTPRW